MGFLSGYRARHKAATLARNAELDRQDREAAERLASLKPIPKFSDVAVDGKCPKCGGASFTRPSEDKGMALATGGLAGLALAASSQGKWIECKTCGEIYQRG